LIPSDGPTKYSTCFAALLVLRPIPPVTLSDVLSLPATLRLKNENGTTCTSDVSISRMRFVNVTAPFVSVPVLTACEPS